MAEKLVIYLEMTEPDQLRPSRTVDGLALVRVADPAGADAARIRTLHDAVAPPHQWSSLSRSDEAWQRSLARPDLSHWVLTDRGTDAGWAALATQDDAVEIASFGLRPGCVGRGYGGWFLSELVRQAWRIRDADPRRDLLDRVWLHTSSWDHPHALGNYLARGFRVSRLEVQRHRPDGGRDHHPVDRRPQLLVRPAVADDAAAIVPLLDALGYHRPVETVRDRVRHLASSADAVVAVVDDDRADVVGVVTAHIIPLFAEVEDAFVRVTALSVAPDATRRGVGRRLIEFVEHVARERGARLLEVSSGRRRERESAHAFYAALGFRDASEAAVRYWKTLETAPPPQP